MDDTALLDRVWTRRIVSTALSVIIRDLTSGSRASTAATSAVRAAHASIRRGTHDAPDGLAFIQSVVETYPMAGIVEPVVWLIQSARFGVVFPRVSAWIENRPAARRGRRMVLSWRNLAHDAGNLLVQLQDEHARERGAVRPPTKRAARGRTWPSTSDDTAGTRRRRDSTPWRSGRR